MVSIRIVRIEKRLPLEVDRHYRLVSLQGRLRPTPVAGPIDHGDLVVNGGLSFDIADPCVGTDVAAAVVDPLAIYLSFRFGPVGVCPQDINGDGDVNVLDLIELLLCFGQPAVPGCEAEDMNGDGTVNVLDLIDLLLVFGTSCP